MASIDDLKKNLNVDNLDKKLREKMFNELVNKGGKVINDKKKNTIQFDRNKQRELKKLEQERREKLKQHSKKQNTGQSSQKKSGSNSNKSGAKTGQEKKKKPRKHFQAFFQGLFAQVFTLSRKMNKKFSEDMNSNLLPLLDELKQTTTRFLSLKEEHKWQAFDKINKIDQFAYETVERINTLARDERVGLIAEYFTSKANINCAEIMPHLIYLLKELFIIYPLKKKLPAIMEAADTIYSERTELKFSDKNQDFAKKFGKLFSYYMIRIFYIVNYNSGNNYKPTYKQIAQLLAIKPEDDIGSITEIKREEKGAYLKELEHEKEDKKEQTSVDEDSGKVPKPIQKGLVLIERIIKDIPERLKHDKNGMVFEPNEKMLLIYFLIKVFDERHSFIMTTFQIEFEPILLERERIDIKLDLDKINLKFNDLLKLLKDYTKEMEEYRYVKNNKSLKEHLRKQQLETINKNRRKQFQDIHYQTTQFFKKFSIILQTLLKDYNDEKRLIENPDDLLIFNLNQITHYFEKTPVIKAIMISFYYTSAVYYYLSKTIVGNNNLYVDEVQDKEKEPEKAQVKEQVKDQEKAQEKEQKEEPKKDQSEEQDKNQGT